MTRNSEHQGRVTPVTDPRGGVWTVGYSAACGSCGWTSGRVHENHSGTLTDLLEHIRNASTPELEGATT